MTNYYQLVKHIQIFHFGAFKKQHQNEVRLGIFTDVKHFLHPDLDWAPLFVGMQERSIPSYDNCNIQCFETSPVMLVYKWDYKLHCNFLKFFSKFEYNFQ